MRPRAYKKYLVVAATLFILVSLPGFLIEGVRAKVVRLFCFSWKMASCMQSQEEIEISQIEGENHLLRIEIGKLRALLEQSVKNNKFKEELSNLSPRRSEEVEYLAALHARSVPARVIYRDPSSFSSSMWINVGEETNRKLNQRIIQKNSPVILGRGVVGVIDFVGKKQSRVRLITDVAVKPSVRAVRGHPQNIALIESIDPMLRHLSSRKDLPLSNDEQIALKQSLEQLKEKIGEGGEAWYLAKGVLQGVGTPLWRNMNHTLRGVGFNYDVPDEEGPARELLSGKAIASSVRTVPIVEVQDLLITTGMDGIFPPGLQVAEITKIFPLKEGAYTYEIEATPILGNLDSLQTVFILPALGYDETEQPRLKI
ncbi:MAG: hypothetical protein S4CHLAM123_12940 [Chlamydiales bacterium]|nr:hypothetical protein [Chlamydiales bacterium]